MEKENLTISIFLGSVRRNRHGKKVADWIEQECKKRGYTIHLIDPLDHKDLLVLTDQYKTKTDPSEDFTKVKNWIEDSDAYIAITPEYNHGYSGALKNMLDCFLEEYFFKCFGIVTYSAGPFGGIRAAEPLRAVCAELGASAIPISLAISSVMKTFDPKGKLTDDSYNKRIGRFLDELEWYASELKINREKGKPY